MTELELYKFVNSNDLEFNKLENEVILFLSFGELEEFSKLIGSSIMEDEGLECHMKSDYICVQMEYICDFHGIDINNVFEDEN